jgi:hypothetical protein
MPISYFSIKCPKIRLFGSENMDEMSLNYKVVLTPNGLRDGTENILIPIRNHVAQK